MRQWLAYYLKAEGAQPPFQIYAAITRPREEAFDANNVITAGSYAELATSTVTEKFRGSAVLVNPASDPLAGFFWDPLIMEAAGELKPYDLPPEAAGVVDNTAAVYEVDVATLTPGTDLFIAGQPTVTLRASTLAPRVQLNVRLFDVTQDTKSLITRGTYTLDSGSGTPIGSARVTITTAGNVWIVPKGHRLRLEISNLDTPYISPSKVPSETRIANVRLDVPVR
jgi:predicted acyl esterase